MDTLIQVTDILPLFVMISFISTYFAESYLCKILTTQQLLFPCAGEKIPPVQHHFTESERNNQGLGYMNLWMFGTSPGVWPSTARFKI
nr:hypothetical protein BgiMline_007001 [Biomphalaria glabrata]